jgi:hypothetical protein
MLTRDTEAQRERTPRSRVAPPTFRRLRGYSYDPSLATQLETAVFAEVTFKVPWEKDLREGPVGQYVEVVDYVPEKGLSQKRGQNG